MNNEKIRELVKAERNAYAKAWRAKNPEKVRAINERYWEKKAAQKLRESESKS